MNVSDLIKTAAEMPLMAHVELYEGTGDIYKSASAFLFLSLQARESGSDEAKVRAIQHAKNFVAGGNEPMFSAGPFWYYAAASMGFAVFRHTPSLWDSLTDDEKDRVDLIMKCYAIASAFVTNDCNFYKTGPSLTGNYAKTWNPNHRMAMIFPIVAAKLYFSAYGDGKEIVDTILTSFGYDEYIEAFEKYGFTRAKYCWTTKGIMLENGVKAPDAKELMLNGGAAYLSVEDSGSKHNKLKIGLPLGDGVGVCHPYTYLGFTLDEIDKIATALYEYNYSGGTIISDTTDFPNGTDEEGKPRSFILDGTKSPYEGRDGMMKELVSRDAGGIRSSTSYCFHDLVLVAQTYAALRSLGAFDIDKKSELWAKIVNGNADIFYKGEHGYNSYSIGKSYTTYETNNATYLLWKNWWILTFGITD